LDLINIAKLGRQWFGESFDIKQDQEFNFPNIDVSTPVKLKQLQLQLIPRLLFRLLSGQTIGNISFPAINTNSDTEFNLFLPNNTSFTGSELVKIKLSYNNNGVLAQKVF
jgi:hypothetical protein